MLATAISPRGDAVVVGATQRLFNFQQLGATSDALYDVSSDGESFVLLRDVKEGSAPPTLTLVQNWFAEFAEHKR
jgi:hypothetical protein